MESKRRDSEMADAAAEEWVNLGAENEKLKEKLRALEERRSEEMASFQRTYDKQIGVELSLQEELAKKPAPDAQTVTALRQFATHVLTFVALYDPKMLEGDGDAARRLRDVRERARAVLEHARPEEPAPLPESHGSRPAPSPEQARVLAKIGKK